MAQDGFFSGLKLPRWLVGRSPVPAPVQYPPILSGNDASILDVFRSEGRGVVWERAQPPAVKNYIGLLGTKYASEIDRLDVGGSVLLEVRDEKTPPPEGMRKPIPVILKSGARGTLDDVFPGTPEEKDAYLSDIEARARDAARLFADWKRTGRTHELLLLIRTEKKEPFPHHTHSFPVMALNHTAPCTIGTNGQPLFPVGSVGIIEPGRPHRSPDVAPGRFRYYNALCYVS